MKNPKPNPKPNPKSAHKPALQGDLFYGVNTCLALWQGRADGIQRLYVTQERVKTIGRVLQWCAQRKRPYHVVTTEDMERITKSVHHEGVAIVMQSHLPMGEADFTATLEGLPSDSPLILIYLDGVKNPHNLGSIIRTSAHFGCPFILGRKAELPRLSPSAARVAEGGILTVELVLLDDPIQTLKTLSHKYGLQIVGTASPGTAKDPQKKPDNKPKPDHRKQSLYEIPLAKRMVIVLGNEVQGMSLDLGEVVDAHRFIPGTGQVESLNVALAAGIIMGEHWRLYGQKT
jgi:TrmH RNA methyltransferase